MGSKKDKIINTILRDLKTYSTKDIHILCSYFNIEPRPMSTKDQKLSVLANSMYKYYSSSNMELVCSSDVDIITLDKWGAKADGTGDINPDIKIGFIRRPDQHELNVECYTLDSMSEWMRDIENYVANWVQKDNTRPIEDEGYGGEAGDKYILKTPMRNYVVGFSHIDTTRPGYYLAVPIASSYRVGNLDSTFGIGQVHGQAPGETIYYIEKLESDSFDAKDIEELYARGLTMNSYPTQMEDKEHLPKKTTERTSEGFYAEENWMLMEYVPSINLQARLPVHLEFNRTIFENEMTKPVNPNNPQYYDYIEVFILLLFLGMMSETPTERQYIKLNSLLSIHGRQFGYGYNLPLPHTEYRIIDLPREFRQHVQSKQYKNLDPSIKNVLVRELYNYIFEYDQYDMQELKSKFDEINNEHAIDETDHPTVLKNLMYNVFYTTPGVPNSKLRDIINSSGVFSPVPDLLFLLKYPPEHSPSEIIDYYTKIAPNPGTLLQLEQSVSSLAEYALDIRNYKQFASNPVAYTPRIMTEWDTQDIINAIVLLLQSERFIPFRMEEFPNEPKNRIILLKELLRVFNLREPYPIPETMTFASEEEREQWQVDEYYKHRGSSYFMKRYTNMINERVLFYVSCVINNKLYDLYRNGILSMPSENVKLPSKTDRYGYMYDEINLFQNDIMITLFYYPPLPIRRFEIPLPLLLKEEKYTYYRYMMLFFDIQFN